MTTWSKVRWSEAGQVLELLGAPAAACAEAKGAPEAFLAKLRAEGDAQRAIDFLAHALPRLEAVAWAAFTTRDFVPQGPSSEPASRALRAALFWVQDPTDNRRRAALDAAEQCDPRGPEALSAYAAFYSGGSIAPAEMGPVPAPKEVTPRMVAGAVKLATLVRGRPPGAADKALDAGEALARTGLQAGA
jgi:hypothetical protein